VTKLFCNETPGLVFGLVIVHLFDGCFGLSLVDKIRIDGGGFPLVEESLEEESPEREGRRESFWSLVDCDTAGVVREFCCEERVRGIGSGRLEGTGLEAETGGVMGCERLVSGVTYKLLSSLSLLPGGSLVSTFRLRVLPVSTQETCRVFEETDSV